MPHPHDQAPTGQNLSPEDFLNLVFDVGGGSELARLRLEETNLAQIMRMGQMGVGGGLLDTLIGVQQNPFSLIPALQAFGATGGGTLGGASALGATGGVPGTSPFGPVVDALIRELGQFAGATPINPNTGMPFTEQEMAFLRIIDAQRQTAEQPSPTAAAATTLAQPALAPSALAAAPTDGGAPPTTFSFERMLQPLAGNRARDLPKRLHLPSAQRRGRIAKKVSRAVARDKEKK